MPCPVSPWEPSTNTSAASCALSFRIGTVREVELLDDAEKEELQRRTLELLFAEATEKRGLAELIETLRQQSRNRAEQSALKSVSRAASSLHEKFIETPGDRPWGKEDIIWPGGSAILAAEDVKAAADKFRNAAFAQADPKLDEKAKAPSRVGWRSPSRTIRLAA